MQKQVSQKFLLQNSDINRLNNLNVHLYIYALRGQFCLRAKDRSAHVFRLYIHRYIVSSLALIVHVQTLREKIYAVTTPQREPSTCVQLCVCINVYIRVYIYSLNLKLTGQYNHPPPADHCPSVNMVAPCHAFIALLFVGM